MIGFSEQQVERILCDTRLIKIDASYPSIRYLTDTIDDLIKMNRDNEAIKASSKVEVDGERLTRFLQVQKQVLISDIQVVGVLDQYALVKCTIENRSGYDLSYIILRLTCVY